MQTSPMTLLCPKIACMMATLSSKIYIPSVQQRKTLTKIFSATLENPQKSIGFPNLRGSLCEIDHAEPPWNNHCILHILHMHKTFIIKSQQPLCDLTVRKLSNHLFCKQPNKHNLACSTLRNMILV
uniref:Uncharacterized protein n=1 Tax=Manihot esculenta TaxID=3983 RepID=A0A2C9VFS2_MANES